MKERYIEAASVIDKRVLGKSGIALGKISDLLIDSREGRIDYASIEIALEETSSRVVYVPWSQLKVSSGGDLTLDVSQETLLGFSRWQTHRTEEH